MSFAVCAISFIIYNILFPLNKHAVHCQHIHNHMHQQKKAKKEEEGTNPISWLHTQQNIGIEKNGNVMRDTPVYIYELYMHHGHAMCKI